MAYDSGVISRFCTKFEIGDPEECWEWLGSISDGGYGWLGVKGRHVKAHRISYEYFNSSEIPEGMQIDHTCVNRKCVNPDHLEAVTQAENLKRALLRRETCKAGHDLNNPDNVRKGTVRKCQVCFKAKNDRNNAKRAERRRQCRKESQVVAPGKTGD